MEDDLFYNLQMEEQMEWGDDKAQNLIPKRRANQDRTIMEQ